MYTYYRHLYVVIVPVISSCYFVIVSIFVYINIIFFNTDKISCSVHIICSIPFGVEIFAEDNLQVLPNFSMCGIDFCYLKIILNKQLLIINFVSSNFAFFEHFQIDKIKSLQNFHAIWYTVYLEYFLLVLAAQGLTGTGK